MTDTGTGQVPEAPGADLRAHIANPVGGLSCAGWREGTLTRAKELESLSIWVLRNPATDGSGERRNEDLLIAIEEHIKAARQAAECHDRRSGDRRGWSCRPGKPSLHERAMSNLDAAEAQLLNVAPPKYLLGQLPSLLNHVQRHLRPDDPRRKYFERLAESLGVHGDDTPTPPGEPDLEKMEARIELERGRIASIVRGASSAALREQVRVRSFRNVVVATIGVMSLLAIVMAILGFASPTTIPLCFQPERGAETMVVCPTAQSEIRAVPQAGDPSPPDVDKLVKETAARADLFVVELIGLAAAAVAAAAAIRGIRGSSERYGLPVALAVLKLPTGALTAVLGLLLMRGQFVPGLTALDTSAQILAWALVLGYAQQLFTRLVDQQAHTVLDTVRGSDEDKKKAVASTRP